MGSTKTPEHDAALNLVPRDQATHIAIGHGSWFDPATWYNGQIPDDDARVLIPEGVHVTYGGLSSSRLFTVRVDGHLDFATDVSSKMVVDTMVVTPNAQLTIGTATDPVQSGVDVDIVIANNGPIDVTWDPMLLSRGVISHGDVEIHGAIKDSHEKVLSDPMQGDTWVEFSQLPQGWEVGDTIVVAGTHYDGYKWDNQINAVRHYQPEDEVRVITSINGGKVFFNQPLLYDHDAPRADLATSVANYTRNVSISTEDPATAAIHERGHVMFMHSDDVDVRYVEFFELGRTDKSQLAMDAQDFTSISFDSNVKGRYSFHLHRTGTGDVNDPAVVTGNAVYGAPGWGFVHHDSNALLDNNATYNTFGAGYVAESGNEIGAWTNNIAIYAQGVSWARPKGAVDLANFDTAKSGDGFWFQGRMVDAIDNIAASVNTGFAYFHRGPIADDAMLPFDASLFDYPDALHYDTAVSPDDAPILHFSGNEAFAAKEGLVVIKANPDQGHDIHSLFEDFTAWSVKSGAHFEYTSHYVIKDFDLIGKDPTPFSTPDSGISFGGNTTDMTIVSPTISGFTTGIDLTKHFTDPNNTPDMHDYTVIDPAISNVSQLYANFDPNLDTILSSGNLAGNQPDLVLNNTLTFSGNIVDITGTKFDSLGQSGFPNGTDSYSLDRMDVARILETDGFYSSGSGSNYFLLDLYFSDRTTGDIYLETHPVYVDPAVPLGSQNTLYASAKYNGTLDLNSPNAPVLDQATLWDALTHGQGTYSNTLPDPDDTAQAASIDLFA